MRSKELVQDVWGFRANKAAHHICSTALMTFQESQYRMVAYIKDAL